MAKKNKVVWKLVLTQFQNQSWCYEDADIIIPIFLEPLERMVSQAWLGLESGLDEGVRVPQLDEHFTVRAVAFRRDVEPRACHLCDFGVIIVEWAPGWSWPLRPRLEPPEFPLLSSGLSALLSIRWQRGAATGHRGQGWGLGVEAWPRPSRAQQPWEFSQLSSGNDESYLLGLGQMKYQTWKDLGRESGSLKTNVSKI